LNATLRRSRALVVVVGLATLLAACGSSSKSGSTGTTTAGGGSSSSIPSGTLSGAGSSFQKTFNEAVISAFQDANKGVTVNYNPVGSGSGKTDLQTKTVDFAGTDSLPAPSDLSSYQGGALLTFPTVAAPITVSYNLSSVKKLQLSGTTLAKIFGLKIKKWNDAAIAADNPGVTLPSTAITVVHRSDSSGTTANFTKFLDDVDKTDWTLGSGDTVNWASLGSTLQGGEKNSGVAQIVKSTDGAVGYVDLADATAAGLQYASIKNSAGKYVAPTVAGAQAAVANATFNADLSYNPVSAAGATAYPITSPTFIIAYEKQTKHTTGTILKGFLEYIYGNGQTIAPTVGYAPLPANAVQKAVAQLSKFQIPAS
jgi:phosphate transport system substrate-binding protein